MLRRLLELTPRERVLLAAGAMWVATARAALVASRSGSFRVMERRLDALDQELQAFRGEYNVSLERTREQLKFNVPVHFEYASSELREADRPVLDRFAAVVKEYYPGAMVTVEGFTDPAGSAAYNRKLGQHRADAVKEYLASAGGFETGQVKAVSYGEARNRQVVPGARGPGDAGIENRRVALVIDHAAIATDQLAMP